MKAICGIAAAVACASATASISYEEEIPAFRPGVDAWRVNLGASGEWSDRGFDVSVPGKPKFYMEYNRYPGMKPFRGAAEIVLSADADFHGPAQAELVLFEFPGGERKRFTAPFDREMRFKTELDLATSYQLGSIGIYRAEKEVSPWSVGFSSLRGVFTTTKAYALHVEAETGNPLHIVRKGMGEKPVLSIRNAAGERITAHGTLQVKGFWGGALDFPVEFALGGGQSLEIPIRGTDANGVWRISGELEADDGSRTKVDTRFAVVDYHGRTAKQRLGTFRLGVLWHLPRFTPEDRQLGAAAMVACGAKLTRADMADMDAIQRDGPDCWNFNRTDELLATLESIGVSLDAIIFNIPKWAAKPENQTNANWKVWKFGRPKPDLFRRFCERLASRYGTRIDYYEIGNEWDLGFRGTLEDAVEIQREAFCGLKSGCPNACVIPNGWAAGGDAAHVVKSGHAGFQEKFLAMCGDLFDVHPVHIHSAFAPYAREIENDFFPMRERVGIARKPWFSNETALTSVWSERSAALTVWKKILWAWAHGSVDFIWYNLVGTGWDPKDPEQGYGLLSADFSPRDTFVAFAALASAVGGAEFRRMIVDQASVFCFEFTRGNSTVWTAWDESGTSREMLVTTDAASAWRVDLMGNRKPLRLSNGLTVFQVSGEPAALILDGATFADADVEAFIADKATAGNDAIAIPSDSPGRNPDFILKRPEQVHDFFAGNPAEIGRLWYGPNDNSAKVWLSMESQGFRIRAEVEDDVHSQPCEGAGQYNGDDIQVAIAVPGRFGQWEFGFAHLDDGRPDVHCWIAPGGFDADNAARRIHLVTGRTGTITHYDALVPYNEVTGFTKKALEDGIRFNLMVNDNDGDGRDATIEIIPNTFHSKDILLAPVVLFTEVPLKEAAGAAGELKEVP